MSRRSYRLPEKVPAGGGGDPPRSRDQLVFDGYVRVSYVGNRVGPRFISPQQQEARIRASAAAHGYRVGRVFVELNRSGRSHDRPELQTLLERIRRGESDGVIVARLDRLSRSVTDALRTLALIEQAGASVISIEDGLNTHTPFGRALATIMLALAELEVARTAEDARASRARTIARGVHVCASPPTGYLRIPGAGLTPDPAQAPLIIAAYQRRTAGATYGEIGRFLAAAGATTARGGSSWSAKAVHKLLQNPVYLGEAFAADTRNPAAHPPLIRRGLWLGALAAASSARAQAHGETLLAGIVRCAGCCHVLGTNHGFSHNGARPGQLIYRCRRLHRAGACPVPAAARGEALEEAVVRAFFAQLDAHRRHRGALDRALATAEDELARLEPRARSHPGWRSAYTEPGDDLAAGRARVLSLWRRQQLAQLPNAVQLRHSWPRLSLSERRRLLAIALETVILTAGPAPPAERILLLFAGARRDWYPKPGLRQPVRPFDLTLASLKRCTDDRTPSQRQRYAAPCPCRP